MVEPKVDRSMKHCTARTKHILVLEQSLQAIIPYHNSQGLQSRNLLLLISKDLQASSLELVQRTVYQIAPQTHTSSLLVFCEVPIQHLRQVVKYHLAPKHHCAVLCPSKCLLHVIPQSQCKAGQGVRSFAPLQKKNDLMTNYAAEHCHADPLHEFAESLFLWRPGFNERRDGFEREIVSTITPIILLNHPPIIAKVKDNKVCESDGKVLRAQ